MANRFKFYRLRVSPASDISQLSYESGAAGLCGILEFSKLPNLLRFQFLLLEAQRVVRILWLGCVNDPLSAFTIQSKVVVVFQAVILGLQQKHFLNCCKLPKRSTFTLEATGGLPSYTAEDSYFIVWCNLRLHWYPHIFGVGASVDPPSWLL